MLISKAQQGFIFGYILPEIKLQKMVLCFDVPKFKMQTCKISNESLRNLFKHLDFDYPRKLEGTPKSYRDLTSKEMTNHIQWIELICGNSGYTMKHIEEEFNRVFNYIER